MLPCMQGRVTRLGDAPYFAAHVDQVSLVRQRFRWRLRRRWRVLLLLLLPLLQLLQVLVLLHDLLLRQLVLLPHVMLLEAAGEAPPGILLLHANLLRH